MAEVAVALGAIGKPEYRLMVAATDSATRGSLSIKVVAEHRIGS
jgi:hypothetical protein